MTEFATLFHQHPVLVSLVLAAVLNYCLVRLGPLLEP